jgi:hypothetical protein
MTTKLFFVTWLAGLPGIVLVAWLVLPILVTGRRLGVPLWVARVASVAQSAVLLALAALAGAVLAPKVHLSAPVLSALVEHEHASDAVFSQLLPSVVGGAIGAAILWIAAAAAPPALAEVQAKFSMPAAARLLYGGVTEELLIRWGLMTVLVWLLWRFAQGGAGIPSAGIVYGAIGISALLFGAGHLPAVAAMIGQMSVGIALYVVVANAVFGLVAGWLYWRFGLESAISAHVLAHAIVLSAPSLRPWPARLKTGVK